MIFTTINKILFTKYGTVRFPIRQTNKHMNLVKKQRLNRYLLI